MGGSVTWRAGHILLAAGAASAAPPKLSLDDCTLVKLGCWKDSKPGDTSPGATGHRVLPYAWCPQGAAIKGQTKTPDNTYAGPDGVKHKPPPCVANKMTPRSCADACLQWIGNPQESKAFTVWSGAEWTQECWCGDTLPAILQMHTAPKPGCSAKCKGDPSITCGGPGGPQGSAVEITRIECGYIDDGWGFSVVVLLFALGGGYISGFSAWNVIVHGKRGKQALPHVPFWQQVHGLVVDGVHLSLRRTGLRIPQAIANRLPAPTPLARQDGHHERLLSQGQGQGGAGSRRSVASVGSKKSSKSASSKKSSRSAKSKGKVMISCELRMLIRGFRGTCRHRNC
jgi:hypothetical protein